MPSRCRSMGRSRAPRFALVAAVMAAATLAASRLPAATFVVNSTEDLPDADQGDNVCAASNGKCTLRAAIMQANFTAGADTITLPPGTYQLTRSGDDDQAVLGDLDITDSLTIIGAGADVTIVDGNGVVTGDRVFDVHETAVNTAMSWHHHQGRQPDGDLRRGVRPPLDGGELRQQPHAQPRDHREQHVLRLGRPVGPSRLGRRLGRARLRGRARQHGLSRCGRPERSARRRRTVRPAPRPGLCKSRVRGRRRLP